MVYARNVAKNLAGRYARIGVKNWVRMHARKVARK